MRYLFLVFVLNFISPNLYANEKAQAERPTHMGSLVFEECELENPDSGTAFTGKCSQLSVPEDPNNPNGRKITLRIGLATAHSANPEPDPVFFLAGGPGQSAVEAYAGIASGFARINEKRHIVLVDQRGTGESHPLHCSQDEEIEQITGTDVEALAIQSDFGNRCAAELSANVDLRQYTTSVAVKDLDLVRQKLGASTINLVGGSYGTRVAQEFLRRYPQHVRSMILDGVAPPESILGAESSRNLEAALDNIFQRCHADKNCAQRFGDPRQNTERLLAELKIAPKSVRYRDPKSGELKTEILNAGRAGIILRMFAYAPETAALLPLTIHDAINGKPEALMAQSDMITGSLEASMTLGMSLAVSCSEDVAQFRADDRDSHEVMGDFVESMLALCRYWPKGDMPEDFHTPLKSDVPTLLLSGEFDPVTPPRYGDNALKQFANGRHLIVPGRGHIVMTSGCLPRLAGEFIEQASAKDLDIQCLETFSRIPAFLNYNGWEP